jgi:tape measure domain-containing protein
MAGNGSARSAGVAYIDLALGDTKALVEGITRTVTAMAAAAQAEMAKAFTFGGDTSSLTAVVEAATTAAEEAGKAVSEALATAGETGTRSLQDSITTGVQTAAQAAATELTSDLAAGAEIAAQQMALMLGQAQLHMPLDQIGVHAATEGARIGTTLGNSVSEGINHSTGSWASFAIPELQRYASRAQSIVGNAFTQAGHDGGEGMMKTFSEFGKGITYSVGSWGIGYAIGNSITTAVSSALSYVKSAVLDFNSEMQSANISFGTLLGSADQAKKMIGDIKQFALTTPFQFQNTVEYSQRLLALGINAKDIIPDLTALGDAVSALGGDPATLNGVVTAFGEMQSIGELSMVHLRQLEIRGIPALKILASEYGVSTSEMKKMISTGTVMSDVALPKLIDGLEHGTKTTKAYGGEMAEQSKTFKGAMSNISDGVTQFAAAGFRPIFDSLNRLAVRAGDFITKGGLENLAPTVASHVASALGSVSHFFGELFRYLAPAAPVIKDIIDNLIRFSILKQIFEALGPTLLVLAQALGAIGHNQLAAKVIADLVEGFIMLKAAQEAWNIVMAITNAVMDANPISLIIIGIAALIVGFVALYQHSETFRNIIASTGAFFGLIWHGILVAFNFVKDGILAGYHWIADGLSSVFHSDQVQGGLKFLGVAFHEFMSVATTAIHAVATVAVWLWKNVIEPVVQGIWFALRLLTVIVFTVLVTPFVIAYHLLEPLIMGLWHHVFKPVFDWIADGAKWLWNNALHPVFTWISGLFTGKLTKEIKALWQDYAMPAFRGIGDAANWLWKNALEPTFHGIGKVFSWLYDWVIRPWFDSLVATFRGIEVIAKWLWKNVFDPVFHGIGTVASWLWDNVLHPVFSGIGTAAKWLYENAIKPAFDSFTHAMKDLGHWASWLYDVAIKPVFNLIGRIIDDVLKGIKSGFKTAVDGISSIWHSLVDILKGPLNFIVDTVYTHGIREVWDFIADKVGIPQLPPAPHFAEGGIIPGPASAGDWIPFYGTAGEGILTVDEMAALGGPSGFAALRAMLGGKGGDQGDDGHFKSGGILGSVGHFFGSIGSGIGDLASFAKRIVQGGLRTVANEMLRPILNGVGSIIPGDSELKRLLVGIPNHMIDGVLGFFGAEDKKANARATAGMSPDLAGWITTAEGLTGVGADWTASLAQLIKMESGGNPRAINNWDSNAQHGDPSRGLMQTIMATFQAYRLKSLPNDIYDPVANIVAGIRYILSRYGSISSVPGIKNLANGGSYVGYATGTDNATPGWSWVGENGPELRYMGGGESILSHKDSVNAVRALNAQSALGLSRQPQAAPVINVDVTVELDGERLDKRVDVKIDRNNDSLARILTGGRTQ